MYSRRVRAAAVLRKIPVDTFIRGDTDASLVRMMTPVYALAAALLISACIIGAGCVTPDSGAGQYTFGMEDNGTSVTVTQGSQITLKLNENPTTGYTWEITADGLTITGDKYEADAPGLVGGGGIHEWYITAGNPGTYVITGIYKRSWEETTGDEETFGITVTVT